MDEALREFVRQRAGERCEYCLLPQSAAIFFTFHVEHIRAKQHGGQDIENNLALACPDCNAHKGPNLTSVDPLTDTVVLIFNPRVNNWTDHFVRQEAAILDLTAIGRATVELLNMNEAERAEMREELLANGEC
jgi:hypothetical protein